MVEQSKKPQQRDQTKRILLLLLLFAIMILFPLVSYWSMGDGRRILIKTENSCNRQVDNHKNRKFCHNQADNQNETSNKN